MRVVLSFFVVVFIFAVVVIVAAGFAKILVCTHMNAAVFVQTSLRFDLATQFCAKAITTRCKAILHTHTHITHIHANALVCLFLFIPIIRCWPNFGRRFVSPLRNWISHATLAICITCNSNIHTHTYHS